ncbi:MAG: hypothetical protein IJH92_08640 [Mogibacterium sp.]|nr:hypothetical protein [Mogibacterium sp.]
MTTYNTLDSFISAIKAELTARMTDSTTEEKDVCKANDLVLHGICIRKNGSDIAPTVYVDEYFNQQMNGRSLDSIVSEMISICENADTESVSKSAETVMDFDNIKDKLTIRLLDARKNRRYLENHPHKAIGGDLVITVDISFDNDYLIAVTDDMNFDEDRLFSTAINNMIEQYPARLMSMETALFGGGSNNALTDGTSHIEGMNTLMNDRSFGATAIVYPMVAEKIRELYSTDFFILPSSQHELILVPDDGNFEANALADMVRQANRSVVEPHDILSDGVFHYSHNGIRRVA